MDNIFALAKTVDIAAIISSYIHLNQRGPHWLGLCPFHADSHAGSFKVTPSKNEFKCWACGAYGDATDFVSMHCNISPYNAAILICETHGLISHDEADAMRSKPREAMKYSQSNRPAAKKEETVLAEKRSIEDLDKVYKAFVKAREGVLSKQYQNALLNERKLGKEELKEYFIFPNPTDEAFWKKFRTELTATTGIENEDDQSRFLVGIPGFFISPKGHITFMASNKPCIAFPVKDRNGLISGIQMRVMARCSEDESRYRFFSSGYANGTEKSYGFYGCNCGYVEDVLFHTDKKWCKAIAITEGRFKAVTLAKMGFLVVNTHSVNNWKPASEVALELAKEYKANRFVLAYDQEENQATQKCIEGMAGNLLKSGRPVDLAVWDKAYGKGIDDVVNAGHKQHISRIPYRVTEKNIA